MKAHFRPDRAMLLGPLLLAACGEPAQPDQPARSASSAAAQAPATALERPPRHPAGWIDVARERGVTYTNASGEAQKATILEAGGAGVAVLDLERDDDLDLVFAQGLPRLDALRSGPGADVAVFLNDGTGNYEPGPAPGLNGWWTGLATGDVNGDGATDVVVAGYGALRVLLQKEDGTLQLAADLSDATNYKPIVIGSEREAGTIPAWNTSLTLFDADRDGALDLYVGRYLDLDPVDPPLDALGDGELKIPCRFKGEPVYCGPVGMVAQADRLLIGNGDGTFRDETGERLPGQVPGYTLATAAFDADGDGDSDLLVANDSSPNLLWINDGAGRFAEHGYAAGIAFSSDGRAEAGMGIDYGDLDRDGRLDFTVTNFSDEPTAIYLGSDVGFFDHSYRSGLHGQTRRLLSWGVHLFDADGDGWLDLFTANGHVYPQADRAASGTRYAQADTLWRFESDLRARAVESTNPNSILQHAAGTRGTALGDLDGDGWPDLVLNRIDAPAAVAFAPVTEYQRVSLHLSGPTQPARTTPRTPRDALGARVVLVVGSGANEHALLDEVQTCAGYQSASTPWLHFGLGTEAGYSALRILWPSGRVENLPGGKAGRRLWIREGEGIVRSEEVAQ